MAKTTTRGRGSGSPTRRTMTAAARAAAKRAERSPASAAVKAPVGGRTVVIEPPDGWDDPPEPSPEDFTEDGPQQTDVRRSRRGPRVAILSVLLVASLVALAVLATHYREGVRAGQARAEALAAARKAAPAVLSYDHRHLDRDFAAAGAHLTGKFRDEYRKTTRTVVGPTAQKYDGVVRATVAEPAGGGAPAASVVSASADEAVVLLFVNQVTRSTQVTGSRVDLNRVRMTMTRTSEGWRVSAVDAL
ncbi:hypothetical protein I2W78_06425 [Streptomyces spinoverrucosus]|uniref:hypothetical protein n=1 Tax=Streptomyces spinoverrucosus TaxID=284043 RepID=UPI0018C39EC4|nr:hypothetical protein [Streptomyces spinoverrucosus]MBG0851491.1 hypothetical protein [Streptomyces spinoverrucosus]